MKKIPITKSSMTSAQRTALEAVVRAESEKAIKRCQYIMMLALMDSLGIGKIRMERFLEKYMEYCDDFKVFQMDDAGDEILFSRLRRRGMEVYRL